MKRHIFGLALFTLIVGTAVFVAGLFVGTSAVPVVTENKSFFEVSKSNCRKGIYRAEAAKLRVVQAVLNLRTRQLETDLFVEREASSTNWVGVKLHFFAKGANGARYLSTEKVMLTPHFNADDKATHSITSSFDWLDKLSARENLYVVAQSTNDSGQKILLPEFDEKSAQPIIKIAKN